MTNHRPVTALSLQDVREGSRITSYISGVPESRLEIEIVSINDDEVNGIEKGEVDPQITYKFIDDESGALHVTNASGIGLAPNSDGTRYRLTEDRLDIADDHIRWAIPFDEDF